MYGEVAIFVVSHVPYSNILMVLIVDVVIGATEMEITNNGSVILRCNVRTYYVSTGQEQ